MTVQNALLHSIKEYYPKEGHSPTSWTQRLTVLCLQHVDKKVLGYLELTARVPSCPTPSLTLS